MVSPPEPVLDAEVLVVGAGPVGCWLAAELCAAGVRVLVTEARRSRAAWSRGFVVHPRTLEIFASRGAAAPLLATGRRVPTWHFAMGASRLDFTALPTSFPFVLLQPQAHTEHLLEEHLNRLGGTVARGQRVVGLEQHADRVTAQVRGDGGERTVSARFVVGCDGAHSTVREAAGIGFTGDPDTMVCPTALVELADPPPPERYVQTGERGVFFAIPLPDGRFVVSTVDHAVMHDVSAVWTADTVRASLLRVAGSDFGMGAAERVSSIGNSAKQAERYRDGRVLLAGDAAHVHFPMGGQGMNLGIQDAHNLAWRLAGAVRAERGGATGFEGFDGFEGFEGAGAFETADALLDGYEAERRPAGERVLEDVRAQMGLVAATGADGVALRSRFEAVLGEHPQVNLQYARRLSGIDVRYPTASGDDGRLGRRVPDLVLESADGTSRQLYDLLREAGAGQFARVRAPRVTGPEWALREGWGAAGSLLIRPDGHVAGIQGE
ncbi:FAD-dependent monooxygenase [Catenulispora subtropica]